VVSLRDDLNNNPFGVDLFSQNRFRRAGFDSFPKGEAFGRCRAGT